MGSIKYIALVLVISAMVLSAFINKKHANVNANANDKGFAVVELFTSEGCSSCPPADAVVAKIEKESAGKPVYILAFHVDYWDRSGWKDIFSSPAYSERQRDYSKTIGSEVYTPQVIVNGTTVMVGSEEAKLRAAINDNLNFAAMSSVSLKNIKINNGKVSFDYQTSGKTDNSTLFLALIQKQAQNVIKAGENNGRTLSHVQIVRAFNSTKLKSNGNASITIPANFDSQGGELVAFIQNNNTRLVTGATNAQL